MKQSLQDIFFHSRNKYIICLSYGIAVVLIYLITKYINLKEGATLPLIHYVDAFFIAGFTLYCFGGFSLIANLGAFDMFGYSFARRKKEGGLKIDYYEYQQVQKEKRRKANPYTYVPYFTVGTLFIIVTIVLNVILTSSI